MFPPLLSFSISRLFARVSTSTTILRRNSVPFRLVVTQPGGAAHEPARMQGDDACVEHQDGDQEQGMTATERLSLLAAQPRTSITNCVAIARKAHTAT